MFGKLWGNLDIETNCNDLPADLSKLFDFLLHSLFLPKPNAYGFDYKPMKLNSRFLSNKKKTELKLFHL